MDLFTLQDFKVFDLPGFQERMDRIRTKIRPKLASIGEFLAPRLSVAVDKPLFLHVAKHMRRTVNPPDDTWAALGCHSRGYKKDVHFKVAVSRHCIRLLFEAGPEYYDKAGWARAWNAEGVGIYPGFRGLSWFENEHDEEPSADIRRAADFRKLGTDWLRRRDGQFVIGRRIDAKEFVSLDSAKFAKVALSTFRPLSILFDLHPQRKLQSGIPAH